jgi:hypothetical protein
VRLTVTVTEELRLLESGFTRAHAFDLECGRDGYMRVIAAGSTSDTYSDCPKCGETCRVWNIRATILTRSPLPIYSARGIPAMQPNLSA